MAERTRVLILGGTAEARRLADRLALESRFDVESSLAGVTADPIRPSGRLRSGGFGGAAGLSDYLRAHHIDLLIDATHPFADTISRHAAAAAIAAGCARLAVQRPPWDQQEGDRWIEVEGVQAAAATVPTLGRRAFLSIGRQEIDAFTGCAGVWFLIRLIDPPPEPPVGLDHLILTGRGPFDPVQEAELLRRHRIDVVISKNSGGLDTYAKIEAARALGLSVLMIRRPPPPAPPVVASVEAALDWIGRRYA